MATLIQSTKPYRMRMSCGHMEIRMMREQTAGVPFTPETIIEVPTCGCAECEITKIDLREHQRKLNLMYLPGGYVRRPD